MKVVVITAITAGRDGLKENQNTEGAEFVAFCDRPLVSNTWEIRPACDLFRDPVRNAKAHKILPHLYFPDYDYSLWIDGTLELMDPAPLLVERYLAECDVVFGRHSVHRSLDDEVEACLREVLDDPALIQEQIEAGGVADSGPGFPLASAILRRHTPTVAQFNAVWWSEICRWSRRDQLSLLMPPRVSDSAGATSRGLPSWIETLSIAISELHTSVGIPTGTAGRMSTSRQPGPMPTPVRQHGGPVDSSSSKR